MAPKGNQQPKNKSSNPLKKTQPVTKKRRAQRNPDSTSDSEDNDMESQSQSTPSFPVVTSSPQTDELKTLFMDLARKIDQSLSATNDIKDDLKEIKTLVSSQGERLTHVEDRVGHAETSVKKLINENEDLRREINKMNLIIDGIPDPAEEDEDALYTRVKVFISDLVGEEISFDTAFRLGHHKLNHRRPIKVRFLSMIQRNLVYTNRGKTAPPFYINEDLPYSILRDHGILRDRKRNEIRNGTHPDQIKIDYKTRTISIANVLHGVNNGILLPQRNPSSLAYSQPQPSSSRAFLGSQRK
jgi:hypothetical protein